MEFKFRNLTKEEIVPRLDEVTKSTVRVLLWKSKFAVHHILDEAVGKLGWKMELTNENKNVRLSVYDKDTNEWVSREGIGDVPTAKALVFDALSFAATQYGIGEELYNGPDIFFYQSDLHGYEKGKPFEFKGCFEVLDIQYQEKVITSVTIGVKDYRDSAVYFKKTFTNETKAVPTPLATSFKPITTAKTELDDDDVILIGYQSGKKYKEVKGTEAFEKFLKWVSTFTSVYNDEKKDEQMRILKEMAKTM